jgi:hypothetical protein
VENKTYLIMLLLLLLVSVTMMQGKKSIRPMMLHSDGGNVKNKKTLLQVL